MNKRSRPVLDPNGSEAIVTDRRSQRRGFHTASVGTKIAPGYVPAQPRTLTRIVLSALRRTFGDTMLVTRPAPHGARSALMNEITSRDIYDAEFADAYTWASFQVRVAQLRNGWTQQRRKTAANPYTKEEIVVHPPQLEEGRDWRRIGTTIVYTARGRRRVISLLRKGK